MKKFSYIYTISTRYVISFLFVIFAKTTLFSSSEKSNDHNKLENMLENSILKCKIDLRPVQGHVPFFSQSNGLNSDHYPLDIFLSKNIIPDTPLPTPLDFKTHSHWHLNCDENGKPEENPFNMRTAFLCSIGSGSRSDSILSKSSGPVTWSLEENILHIRLMSHDLKPMNHHSPENNSFHLLNHSSKESSVEISIPATLIYQVFADSSQNESFIEDCNTQKTLKTKRGRPIRISNSILITSQEVHDSQFALQLAGEVKLESIDTPPSPMICNKEHDFTEKEFVYISNAYKRHCIQVHDNMNQFYTSLLPRISPHYEKKPQVDEQEIDNTDEKDKNPAKSESTGDEGENTQKEHTPKAGIISMYIPADNNLEDKIIRSDLPEYVKSAALNEYQHIADGNKSGQDYHKSRIYIDEWLLKLPWNKLSIETLNMKKMSECLEESHYGQTDIKARIREYLAGMILKKKRTEKLIKTECKKIKTLNSSSDIHLESNDQPNIDDESAGDDTPFSTNNIENNENLINKHHHRATILCLSGPPGTGKTSIASSIAKALNRECIKISLGYLNKSYDLVGFNKTIAGSQPGSIIKRIRDCGTRNPVVILDELDKIKKGGFHTDGAGILATLLEILDPRENCHYTDRYIDLPFDLSDCIFIGTANSIDAIPEPVKDRMEIIEIPGYTQEEKAEILQHYIIPRAIASFHIKPDELFFNNESIQFLIEHYSHEEGVRELEKIIHRLAEKIILKFFFDENGDIMEHISIEITPELIQELIKPKEKDCFCWKHMYN